MYTGSSGLSVAYLSGLDGVTRRGPAYPGTHYAKEDVEALCIPLTSDPEFKGVDLLLTAQCPAGVEKYANDIVSPCLLYRVQRVV